MDKSAFERFYSKIFTIPKKRISVTLGVITIAIASLQYSIARAFFAQRYFFLGLLLIVLILAVGRTINLAFNGRRVFFLALLLLIFIEAFDFIVYHLGFPYLISLTPAVISSFLTIILYFCSEAREANVYVLSLSMVLLLYPFSYFYFDLYYDLPAHFEVQGLTAGYVFIAVVGVIAGHAYLRFLDTERGFNIKSFFRAFLLFWLTGNPAYFEARLKEVATRMQGWVRCLSIGDVRVIANAFHPGPLRNVGGARLVHRVLEQPRTMYLHSATTHDRNVVSAADVEAVIQHISCGDVELQAHRPFCIEGDEFTVTAFPFDAFRLLIVSGTIMIDDLPPEVQEYADSLGEILVVDAHNAYRKEYDVTPAQVEEIKSLIRQAAETEAEPADMRYAFRKKAVASQNICGYLALLRLDYGDERYALFMIDANNIDLSFRRDIEAFFEEQDIHPVVVSTDNHAKTGMPPSLEYQPAGDHPSDVSTVFEFLEECNPRATIEPAISYGKQSVAINVIGEHFFNDLEGAVRSIGKQAVILFFLVISLQLILAMLTGFALV
ncbi:MAG: DUF2070 family protein [Thermoplasmatota archaeon]